MTLRPISVPGDVVAADPGPRPVLSWVPIRHLMIDEDYQRPLGDTNWRRIRAIAAAFDWLRFSPVMVAPVADQPGVFAVIDGQHRVHAALMAGQTEVPALIVAADVAQQATSFIAVNAQATGVSPLHVLRAELGAGNPLALAMRDAVDAAGARLMTAQTSAALRKPGQVFASILIRRHVAAGRGGVVTAGLAALRASKLGGQRRFWDDTFLAPWLRALADVPLAVGRADLAAFLDQHDWVRIRAGAERMRAQPGYARQSVHGIFGALVTAMLRQWLASVASEVAS